jgi:hypothetical protein
MVATLESTMLLPRTLFTVSVVNREVVRSILQAERARCALAIQLGEDVDEAHRGFAPYIEALTGQLSTQDKAEFNRLLVEESLVSEDLDKAKAKLATAQQDYAAALNEAKSVNRPSTARIFFAGVNVTIWIGLALYWFLK